MMETSCKLSFHGASGNSCPHSLLWVQAPCSATTHDGQASDGGGGDESNNKLVDTVIYASSGVINLATSHETTSNNCITSVAKTLITRTLDHSSAPQPSLMEVNPTDDGNVVATTAAAATKRVLARGEAVEDAAAPRSITALTWFVEANHTSFGIVSAFSDGTVTIWKKCNNNEEEWVEHVLIGHDPDTRKRAKHLVHQENFDAGNLQESIADISAVSLATNTTLVATASSKGIIIHIASQSQQLEKEEVYSRQLSHHASASAHFVERKNNECYLFAGSASPRHNKVWVYTIPHFSAIADSSDSPWVKLPLVTVCDPICHGSLLGHQDWISCFAWLNLNKCNSDEDREEALLASSGHDAKIRLWKFSTRASQPLTMTSSEVVSGKEEDDDEVMGDNVDDDDTTIEGEDEEDEANIDDLEEEGEARLMIYHGGSSSTAVSLEALLFGHEESVTSLTWRNRTTSNSKPCLLSSSMDRTILLWMEDEDVWAPISRVGSAGGILGGSIGASLMGFVDARFSPESNRIVGHGYGGSIHLWTQEELDAAEKQEEEDDDDELLSARWVADPCITGHFRSVEDMAWDPQGEYLLTTSSDQTTRLWAEVTVGSTECRWVEVGRPQVHGYDMTSIACVGGSETASNDEGVPRHRFISGADEKVLRVFDAPISTLRLLQSLKDSRLSSNSNSNSPNEDSMSWRVERAFLPSLGLSNKATADQEQESSKFSGPTNDDEFAETLDTLERKHEDFTLPSERDLGVTTLWPESRKLFGHESELVCLDSYRALSGSDEPSLVASSCKARNDVASAAIRLWNVKDGKCVGILKGGHRSTVSTMSFSLDGRYLASSGKDRRICIWKKVDSLSNNSDGGATGGYELAAAADSAHKRIVWSVHFCPSMPNILASGSRDGFVRVWKVCETDEGDQLKELVKFEPSTKGGKKSEPVTAVAFAEGLPNNDNQIGILGIGTESGRIEVWATPVSDGSALKEPTLLHAIAATDCHFGTVKKLAWRPSFKVEDKKSSSSLGFTLASCSQDSGVRIFNISINMK